MADVFDGFDEALQRPVAVKRLRPELAEDPDLRRRFAREARAGARIAHPNVVAIYDVGEHVGSPFFVMERLPGPSLHDELHAGPIPTARLRKLAAEILGALGAAHRLGILHRDVKPANVLLDETGHAKVGDFGIAQVSDELHHTSTGLVLGTLSYLPPERLAGGPATPEGDLYGCGVLLFEAATGRPAFRADTPLALTRAVAMDEPTFRPAERERLGAGFVAAVTRAMAKDPADRFATADEMLDALRSRPGDPPATVRAVAAPTVPVHAEEPATHRLPAARRAVVPGRRRRRHVAIGAGVIVLALAAGSAVALAGLDAPDAPRPASTSATSTPPGSTPVRLGRALDGLDRAIDR